ncbi:TonB-dependent receptor domain-containing protein [Sphingopyxis fribergensis]|uniref:TonB-dependent receptor domain-containing protein n=1 Tax=Sphingopyxis fribergensis TaxID=1515612 RepID=UPI00057D6B67|nr:TonB-dependent receptor [Sphingopyxis fribergensis]
MRQFTQQTGIQVGYEPGDVAGRQSAPLTGKLSAAQALSRLLEGSGLSYRFTARTAVRLERAPVAADGVVQLGTLRVEGASGAGGTGTGGSAVPPESRAFTTAQSSTVRSQDDILTFRGTSTGDFLSGIPGVLNGDNRNSGALDVNIRGMQGMDRVPVVIDGSLQQSTVYRGYSGVAGRTYLDPDLIGSVIVEKGPSASADGVGATGGVVRVDTIGAKDLIAPRSDFGIRFRGSLIGNNVAPPEIATLGTGAGTAERFDRPGPLDLNGSSFSVAVAGRVGDFEVVGAVAKREVGNYFGGDHGTVPPGGTNVTGGVLQRYNLGEEVLSTSQDNTSYLLRGTYRFGNGHGLDLSYVRYESDFGEMMPSQIIRFGGALEAPLSRAEVDTYTARYRWNPDDNDLINLKADLWKTSSFTSIETLYRYTFGSWVSIQDAAYQSQSDRWGINISNRSGLETAFGRLELDYGASYTRERLTPPDGWETYKNNSGYTAFVEPRDGWRNEYSAFVAGELRPNEWVSFNAALRYTNTESHDNNLTDTWAGSPQVNVTGYNHEKNDGFAPIVSFVIEPLKGLQFYARYAEAIRNPSLFESTTGFSFYPDPRNPIRPERARNTELGINLQQARIVSDSDLLQAKFSYFTNDIDDYLTRGASDGLNSVVNIQHARLQGIEALLRYDAGIVFANVGGTFYTSKEFCDYDNVCREGGTSNSYVPAHLPPKFGLNADIGVRLFDERLVLGGRYIHVGERDTPIITFGGSVTTIDWKPYDIFDLYGSFDLNDQLRLDVAVDNVTDRYYMDALTLGLMPSPGRTFRIGVTAAFGGPERTRSHRQHAIDALDGREPLAAFDGDWSGPYAGLNAGHSFVSTKGTTVAGDSTEGGIPATESANTSFDGSQIGLVAGMTWKLGGPWVVGVEGDFGISRASGHQYTRSTELLPVLFDFYPQDRSNQADTEYASDWTASLRGRLGYSAGRVLLFGTGGLAFMQEAQTRTQHIDSATLSYFNVNRRFSQNSAPFFSEKATKLRTGWTVGGGAELALGNQWSVRGEYGYTRFGTSEFHFEDARAGVGQTFEVLGAYLRDPVTNALIRDPVTNQFVRAPSTAYPGTASVVTGRRARNDAEMHSVRIGISYRF